MASEYLLIFTRYPEVGQVKTRLIPVLGAEAANVLHRQMTEHTLIQVQALRDRYLNKLQITVQFAGDPSILDLQTWLGAEVEYKPQSCGDLGERMANGFQVSFEHGARKVITIGTDCPGITPPLLNQAFIALDQAEVVLGPALDGGYYLIGLKSPQPKLFEKIRWGTSTVLEETLAVIEQLHLSYTCLQSLADVDRPEDLVVWETAIAAINS